MLILSRKRDERVVVGGNITITVVQIRDGVVRLGFDAPREIMVLREELVQNTGQVEPKGGPP